MEVSEMGVDYKKKRELYEETGLSVLLSVPQCQ
jgi:hypothetical protein